MERRRSPQKYGKYSEVYKFLIIIIVLRAVVVAILDPKLVAISKRNTIKRKFAKFVRLYFPHITTFYNQTFFKH